MMSMGVTIATMPGMMRDGDTSRAISRMTTAKPPAGRIGHLDQMVRKLRSHFIWPKLDLFFVPAAHAQQAAQINWRGPSTYDLNEVSTPTWTVDQGYRNVSTTSYLSLPNWKPGNNAVFMAQNDTSHGIWVVSTASDAAASARSHGWTDASGNPHDIILAPWRTTAIGSRVNATGAGGDTSGSVSTRLGLTTIDRQSSTAWTGYRNGVSVGTQSSTSTGLGAQVVPYLTVLNFTAPANASNDTIGIVFYGAGFSEAQHQAMYSVMRAYLAAIGAV